MIIRIKDLRLRAIIGCNAWEREKKQDITINVVMECESDKAIANDDINDTTDYREITKNIIEGVEKSNFFLIERLAGFILSMVMKAPGVRSASVEVDKPHALRFSRSVSVEVSAAR
ncbi:MAG: dihydroneopterin aldolase [Thermodesulfobacteriota bacterium]